MRRFLGFFLAAALAWPLAAAAADPTPAPGRPAPGSAVRGDYAPDLGLRLRSPEGAVLLGVPAGALAEPATFSYAGLARPERTGALRIARSFRLEAHASAGGRAITRFARPLVLTVRYDDADLARLAAPAAALRLFYQETDGAWVLIPSTVDEAGRVVTGSVDHFTDFALGAAGATDNFNRADDAASLGTAESGQSWLTDGSTWGICAGGACTAGPPQSGNYVRIDAGVRDQRASAVVRPRPAGSPGQAGLLLGMTPDWNTNLLYVGLDATGLVEVWTLTDMLWSAGAIASAQTSYTAAAARTLEARTLGSELRVYVDGVLVLGPTAVPAAPPAGTLAGLFADTTDASAERWPRFDAFQVLPSP